MECWSNGLIQDAGLGIRDARVNLYLASRIMGHVF